MASPSLLDERAARALEEKYDPEVRFRPLLPPAAWLVAALLFGLSSFHYYTAGFGLLQETFHRGIHMACVIGLVFLVFARAKHLQAVARPSSLLTPGGVPLYDWALAATAAAASLYVPWIFDDLAFRVGNPLWLDVAMGTGLIVVLLEA
ncbi:MAG: TRAP transporter permease, partial [Alphaproteobacteria bacterium]|nr:TRAP transporter permease [Alphaproteobacteria bacterium]